MKLLPVLFLSVLPLSATPENPLIPDTWFTDVTATDGSVQQCIIFTTIPGVEYTFYHSSTLEIWSEIGKTYGLGHQFSAAMRETAPAPPPANPTNPPPAGPILQPASITIKPSSGTAGGTVVSWPSLDHGNAVQFRIAGTMASAWSSVPIFAGSRGGHQFFISHTPGAMAPPAQNPILASKDAAMLADLEGGWSAFNTTLTTTQQIARNTPPPPPPARDARGFWRIKADWTLDSDGDGSPDHLEFSNAVAGPNGLAGNAFNADTDGNGIPDGKQLDGDNDGTPDAQDTAANDASATFQIGAVPRYAIFPITNAQPQAPFQEPLQINDRGTVLYSSGTWAGGIWRGLVENAGNLRGATARAINDKNVILGGGWLTLNPGGNEYLLTSACYWNTLEGSPSPILTSGATPIYASASYDFLYGLLAPGPVISNDGKFFQPSYQWNGTQYAYLRQSLWSLPGAGGGLATESSASDELRFFVSDNLKWGHDKDFKGVVQAGGTLPPLPFFPTNIAQAPNQRLIAMSASPNSPAQVHYGGSWHKETIYSGAIDVAADGTAIGKNTDGRQAPLLINGKWTNLSRAAPGIPETWADGSASLIDTTPGGWALATDTAPIASAAMLPLRLEGLPESVPSGVPTIADSTGVDDFSVGADLVDPSAQDRLWIMAPSIAGKTTVNVNAPLHPSAPVWMSATGVRFNGSALLQLNSASKSVEVTYALPTSGNEVLAEITAGGGQSISKPIGFKVMKQRTVRVTVYLVNKQTPGNPNVSAPDLVTTAQNLQNYLNSVFKPQINVEIVVKSTYQTISAPWDLNGNGYLDCTGPETDPGPEQQMIMNLVEETNLAPHISIFLMGGGIPILSKVAGYAHLNSRTIWITADSFRGLRLEDQPFIIGHEIGHFFFGLGHPDEGGGPASLPGTKHQRRLMVSGNGAARKPGILIVKGEWDAADIWLRNKIDKEKE